MVADAKKLQKYAMLQSAVGVLFWIGIYLFGPPGSFRFTGGASSFLSLPAFFSFPLLFLLFLLFSFSAWRLRFRLPSNYFVSFDLSFSVAGFFLLSPAAAASLSVLTLVLDEVFPGGGAQGRVNRWARFYDNLGNRLLRVGSAWLAFYAVGGRLPISEENLCVLPSLVALVVYHVVNNLFYLPSEYFRGGDIGAFLKESVRADLMHTLFILVLGYMMALIASAIGLIAFLVQAAVVLALSWLFSVLTSTQTSLKDKLDDLVALSQVASAASSGLDVLPMVEAFTKKLGEALRADGIGVIFYQRYSTTLYLVQCEGEKNRATYLSEEKRFQYEELPLSEPSERLGQRLFEFLQPLETAPFTLPASTFGLPLLHGGEPFGGIVVYSYREGVSFKNRQELLETCAQSLVVGLENCFLHLQAIQDPLTGLFNRSYFLYRLEEELSYSSRHRAPFAVMMMDLDDFKAVNDHLGHAQGDRVLHKIGDLLRRGLRREDVPARYGGDEFIILLLNCEEKDALEKAEKLRRSVATKARPKEEAGGLSIGCSLGILTSNNLRGEQDIPMILKRLDQALYKAKSEGKNQVAKAE